jgi:hypothetical protein
MVASLKAQAQQQALDAIQARTAATAEADVHSRKV